MSIAPFAHYFTSLSFCCWIVRVLCMFIIWNPYQIYDLKIFLSVTCLFTILFFNAQKFLTWWSSINVFSSGVISENALLNPSYEDLLCFLLKFYCFSSYFWVFDPFLNIFCIYCEVRVQLYSFAFACYQALSTFLGSNTVEMNIPTTRLLSKQIFFICVIFCPQGRRQKRLPNDSTICFEEQI